MRNLNGQCWLLFTVPRSMLGALPSFPICKMEGEMLGSMLRLYCTVEVYFAQVHQVSTNFVLVQPS